MNHEQVLGLITGREAVATAQAEQLREQIAALTEQLVVVDAELSDLATTRSTLLRLTGTDRRPAPTDATVTSRAYQQILAVFAATSDPLRAKDICLCARHRYRRDEHRKPARQTQTPRQSRHSHRTRIRPVHSRPARHQQP